MSPWIGSTCAICGAGGGDKLFAVSVRGAPADGAYVVRCTRCGLRRLDPRPDQDTLKAYYGSEYYAYTGRRRSALKQRVWDVLRDLSAGARDDAASRVAAPLARALGRHVFDIVVPVDVRRPSVVDVGCGYGDLLIYLKSRGCEVVGVELDEVAAAKGAGYGIPIHVGDLRDLELPVASRDVVVLQHSLEHIADPEATIAEVARILRSGGQVHVALPNGDAVGLAVQRATWGCLFPPEHFWYFDRQSLGALLERHWLRVVRFGYKTIWANHRNLWRAIAAEHGRAASAAAAAEFLARWAVARRGGDILRLVAERV